MALTLSGTGQDISILLSLLDQILSAEFFSKISKLFWRWKFTSIRLFWHPAQLIESYKSCPLEALKMSIFLASNVMPDRVKEAKTKEIIVFVVGTFLY